MELIRKAVINKLIYAAIGIAMISIVSIETHKIMLFYTEPVTYIDTKAVTPQVKAGNKLIMSYTYSRNRICKTNIDRFITREDTNEIVFRQSVIGGPFNIGTVTVKNIVAIPEDFDPGMYYFTTFTYSNCYEGLRSAVAPKIRFEVIK